MQECCHTYSGERSACDETRQAQGISRVRKDFQGTHQPGFEYCTIVGVHLYHSCTKTVSRVMSIFDSSSIFPTFLHRRMLFFLLIFRLSRRSAYGAHPERFAESCFRRFVLLKSRPSHNRRSLAELGDLQTDGAPDVSVSKLHSLLAEYRVKLPGLEQDSKNLLHDKTPLENSIQLRKRQVPMQDGQVKLSKAALEERSREIEMYGCNPCEPWDDITSFSDVSANFSKLPAE